MRRKLMLVLLAGAICLLAVTSVLAQRNPELYNASDYEKLTGKKMVYQEAPMLRTMVAAGELPPVEQRLPEDPLVVGPSEEIGQYGGTLRILNEGPGASNWSMDYGFEFLIAWTPDVRGTFSNVLKGWEASEDAKKYTLYLRKGMKWSDGHPFTADDLMFWYEDIALKKELTPVMPGRFTIDGKPGVMRRIDDYTVEVSFPSSFGFFPESFTRFRPDPYAPKHYLIQFHPDYTPMSEIEKVMKKEGFDTWIELFQAKRGGTWDFWNNPDRPTLSQFIAQNLETESIQIQTRNPYYWKVDTEGNQLPYIDRVERYMVTDAEARLLKALAGEVDLCDNGSLGGMANFSILAQYQEKGDYELIPRSLTTGYGGVIGSVGFNMSHEDPVLKKLFNDKNFRIALSVAINREEANGLIYKGMGKPSHLGIGPDGPPHHPEKYFQDYLQYDPELADKLLDELGLARRDKQGYRLRPDGERLRMRYTVQGLWAGQQEIAELYRGYWKQVGIEVVLKSMDPKLWVAVQLAGDYELCTVGAGMGALYGGVNLIVRRPMMPMDDAFVIAPQWGLWIGSKGEKGEEPPEAIKQIAELQQKALVMADADKRVLLTLEIMEIYEDNFWIFGGVAGPKAPYVWVKHNRIGNATQEGGIKWEGTSKGILFIKE